MTTDHVNKVTFEAGGDAWFLPANGTTTGRSVSRD